MAIITSKTLNGVELLKVNSSPSGITSPIGSIALDTSTGNKYKSEGGGAWKLLTSGTPIDRIIAGPQGLQGFQGNQGYQGYQGTSGLQGAQGSGTQGLQGAQGVPGSNGGGGTGGLPVINVTTDLVGLGYATNVVADSVSGGDAIQDAINHFLLHPADFYAIYIPPGVYNISKSLIIAYPPLGNAAAGTWSQCNIISSLNMFPDVGGAAIQWNSGLGKVDPMLVIQGARNVSLSGITFNGPNIAPFNLLNEPNHYEALFTSEYADWLSSGIRDNSRSPQCCVVVDPFVNENPGDSASNRYPNLTSYYVGKYQRSSSNIVFENCAFRKSNFGVVISPTGPVKKIDENGDYVLDAYGNYIYVDVIANSENFYFKNCFFEYNRVHYSTGQSQARANNLFSPRMIGSWISIDTELVGPAGTAGVAPTFSGAPNIGGCKYVFNVNTSGQMLDFSNGYCESIASLGRIDLGSGTNCGARMASCTFTFICPGDVGTDVGASSAAGGTVAGIPYHLSVMSTLHMDCCTINTGDYPLKIWTSDESSSRLKLTLCSILTPSVNGTVQAGFNNTGTVSIVERGVVQIDSIKVRGISGIKIQDNPILGYPVSGKISTKDIQGTLTVGPGNNTGVLFTQGANPTIGTFTITSGESAYLQQGDLIAQYNGEASSVFTPELFTSNSAASDELYGVIGKVQSISSSGATRTVTIKHIHKGFKFDSLMNVRRLRWITV